MELSPKRICLISINISLLTLNWYRRDNIIRGLHIYLFKKGRKNASNVRSTVFLEQYKNMNNNIKYLYVYGSMLLQYKRKYIQLFITYFILFIKECYKIKVPLYDQEEQIMFTVFHPSSPALSFAHSCFGLRKFNYKTNSWFIPTY